MGQYHLTVNLDKREFLFPHDLGDGLKLWEQGASAQGTLAALQMLLAVSNGRGGGDYDETAPDGSAIEFFGRWAGDRIVVIGDYGEPGDLAGIAVLPEDEFCGACLYAMCSTAHAYPDGMTDDPQEPCSSCGRSVTGEGWTNVSPILAPVLEHEFEFKFKGNGWRERSHA